MHICFKNSTTKMSDVSFNYNDKEYKLFKITLINEKIFNYSYKPIHTAIIHLGWLKVFELYDECIILINEAENSL